MRTHIPYFQLPYGADSPWSRQEPTSTPVEVLAAAVDGSNGVKNIHSMSNQGQHVSSIYTATAIVQLQHLKYAFLILRLTVGVSEEAKGKG